MSVDKQILPLPVVDDVDDQIRDECCRQQKIKNEIIADSSSSYIACDLKDERRNNVKNKKDDHRTGTVFTEPAEVMECIDLIYAQGNSDVAVYRIDRVQHRIKSVYYERVQTVQMIYVSGTSDESANNTQKSSVEPNNHQEVMP